MAIHIVMVEPEIPPNTGNVARTCAATGSVLHLVKPLGFRIDDKSLKRAGLDYWPYVKLEIHENIDEFLKKYKDRNMYFAATKGKNLYTEVNYSDGDMILFGKETKGLNPYLIEKNKDFTVRIPMSPEARSRSFNLSNSVNIILFEALRQMNFIGLK